MIMKCWVRAAVVVALSASLPAGLRVAHAGQLPDDVNPESRSRLPPIDREELDPARRSAFDAAVASPDGAPAGAAALRLHGSGASLRFEAPMGRRLTELTVLTTAREYDQPYEWALHELEALAVGLDDEVIDVVRHRKPFAGLPDRQAIVIELGRELFGTRALGSDTYARALALLGKTNLVDVVDVMGRYASTAATLTAFNQRMPEGWRQSLPLPFTHPDDIHPDSRSRLPLRSPASRTAVAELYGRMLSPSGIGPGVIRSYGAGQATLEARVGRRLMQLAVLVTARAHDSQYDWTMNEPRAREGRPRARAHRPRPRRRGAGGHRREGRRAHRVRARALRRPQRPRGDLRSRRARVRRREPRGYRRPDGRARRGRRGTGGLRPAPAGGRRAAPAAPVGGSPVGGSPHDAQNDARTERDPGRGRPARGAGGHPRPGGSAHRRPRAAARRRPLGDSTPPSSTRSASASSPAGWSIRGRSRSCRTAGC